MGGREGQNCNGCKSWLEDIYWSHFQFIHFAQFLRSDFNQHLELPKTFSDKIEKKLPENVDLKGPGGVVWNVGVTIKDDTLYFTRGWQQFVKDHSLKENDFLVFKYNRESVFDVLMFDGVNLCEKAGSYFVRKCEHVQTEPHGNGCSNKRRDTGNSVEEVNTPSNGAAECDSLQKYANVNNIGVALAVPSETDIEKICSDAVELACSGKNMADAVTIAEPAPTLSPNQTTGKRTRRPVYANNHAVNPAKKKLKGKRTTSLNSPNEVSAEPASVGKSSTATSELFTSNRRPVTEPEIQNALQLAQAACTPECVCVVMRPTHVYKRFYVSLNNKWMLNLISPTTQDVILRVGKAEWLSKYSYNNIRHCGGLTRGWKYFALENNLEEFDVCVFKPAGRMSNVLILEVSIFRVVDEITPVSAMNSAGKWKGRAKKKSMDVVEAPNVTSGGA